MSLTAIATVLCTAVPSATALDFPAATPTDCPTIQAGIHVTPTHLTARNFSHLPQLLVFSDAETDLRTLRALEAGATLELDFARDALTTARLELLHYSRGTWTPSGTFDLSTALTSGESTFWFQPVAGTIHTWSQSGATLDLLESDETALPETLRPPTTATVATATTCAPTHVPVVTPGQRPKGDRPPKLERRPLPPV
jgi:hypothetical protein